MKTAMKIFACIVAFVAHTSGFVVDRSEGVSLASYGDVIESSGETPAILDLLTRLDVRLHSLEESQLKVEDDSFDQQKNKLNEAEQVSISRNTRDADCKEPSQERLQSQLLQAKFFSTPTTRTQYVNQLDEFRKTFGSPYGPRSSCSIRPSSDLLNQPLNKKTSCPWKIEEHTDENRFPKTISFAKCECTRCIQGNGKQTSNFCRPIIEPQYVLKKGQCGDNNEYQYEISQEYVSVGCACVRSSTV